MVYNNNWELFLVTAPNYQIIINVCCFLVITYLVIIKIGKENENAEE